MHTGGCCGTWGVASNAGHPLTNRGGAVAYLATYDVHRGTVLGRCEQSTGIDPFCRLVTQLVKQEPHKSAERVFWIVDSGSCLNQIEIYFSIVQRNVVSPNDFTDLDEVIARLARFETRYNQTARPLTRR